MVHSISNVTVSWQIKNAFAAPCGIIHYDLFIICFFGVIVIKIEHSIVSGVQRLGIQCSIFYWVN